MIVSGLPANVPMFDPSNFLGWPLWRQSFEIFILASTNNEMGDRQKLGVLLHCLGPVARVLLNDWFPGLLNINETMGLKVTYYDVLSRLNEYCGEKTNEVLENQNGQGDVEETPLTKEQREIADFEAELKASERCFSLQELEQAVRFGVDKSLVVSFLEIGGQLLINSKTVWDLFPPHEDVYIYREYAKITKNLRLEDLDGNYPVRLFNLFPFIEELTVSNVDLRCARLPRFLRKLTVFRCRVSTESFKGASLQLETLHIKNTEYSEHSFSSMNRLKILRIENVPDQKESVTSNASPPHLEDLYVDLGSDVNYKYPFPRGCLFKSLTLGTIWPDMKSAFYQTLQTYMDLEKLTIQRPVHVSRRGEVEALPVKEVLVEYYE